MGYENPFDLPGKWWRGNLHSHTTISDGVGAPAYWVEQYRLQGYDFLALTDHDTIGDVRFDDGDDLLVLPGCEYDLEVAGGDRCHIVALNVNRENDAAGKMSVDQIVTFIRDQGGLPMIAHPYWSGLSSALLLPFASQCFALEVFNSMCHNNVGKGIAETHWDELLSGSVPILGVACDDTHSEVDAYQGWVMVKATELRRESIVSALSAGAFYSTQGPEIQECRVVEASDAGRATRQLVVRCSPATSITFKAHNACGRRFYDRDGGLLCDASFPIRGFERFIRVVIEDSVGQRAWTQPLFVE